MAWNTGTSYTGASFLTSALINGIGNDLRTWGGNVDAGGYTLANLAAITGSSILSISPVRTYLKANSEPYALGLYYNAASVTPFFLGAASSGDLIGSSAGGVERVRITQAGNVGIGTASPVSALDVHGTLSNLTSLPTTFDITASFSNNNAAAAVTAGIVRIASANTAAANSLLTCVTPSSSVFEVRASGQIIITALPSANPGAGTKEMWYDPADGNRIKFAA